MSNADQLDWQITPTGLVFPITDGCENKGMRFSPLFVQAKSRIECHPVIRSIARQSLLDSAIFDK